MAEIRIKMNGSSVSYSVPDDMDDEDINDIFRQHLRGLPLEIIDDNDVKPVGESGVNRRGFRIVPDQSIVERGSFLPIGKTADGDVEFATPGFIMSPLQSLSNLINSLSTGEVSEDDLIEFGLSVTPQGLAARMARRLPKNIGLKEQRASEAKRALQEERGIENRTVAERRDTIDRERAAEQQQFTDFKDESARLRRFQRQNIGATRGDVSQNFAQQAEEQRLMSMATGAEGEPLREFKLKQSNKFIVAVNDTVNALGVPSETGDSIKSALTGRQSLLRKEKNSLYKEVADTSPEILNTPLFVDDIANALPNKEILEDISIVGANVEGIEKSLVRFGVDKDPVAIEKYIEGGGTITPLTLGNHDRLRKILGGLERADVTGSTSVAIGPLKRALDEEILFIDNAINESGVTDQGVINTLKEARKRVMTLKTEFSPQSISGRLIGVKRDGVTPIVEASKITQELLRPGTPIENLDRTLRSLRGSGTKGSKAIQDLRASVIMDALESALKAPSRKISGMETIGGNQFAKALDKFGDDKLDLLFKGNERALEKLRDLKQISLDIMPASGAVPRGSAPVILDTIKRLGRLPGLAVIEDVITSVIRAGSDDRAVARALKSDPIMKRKLIQFNTVYPFTAHRIGLLSMLDTLDVSAGKKDPPSTGLKMFSGKVIEPV